MPLLNVEFKAKADNIRELENKLLALLPKFIGEDHQVDTYFNIPNSRLKLREGNIENALIYYERKDTAGAKQSHIILYEHKPDKNLKKILTSAHGIKAVVDKLRKIYFIDNVKFHFDKVKGLGEFVEVEAIDKDENIGVEKLKEQCDHYSSFFGINPSDYIAVSYSDMILEIPQSQFTIHY
jgi:adenylate cyclase class 2